MRHFYKIVFIVLILGLLNCFIIVTSKAASTEANKGITVAPAVIKTTIAKSDTEQITAIGVRNNYSVPINLEAQLKSVDQDQAILTPARDLDGKLSEVLTISPSSFVLQPGQSINIQLKVKNSPVLNPGGNYAAIVIKQSAITGNAIGLQSAISVSVFINKQEGAIHQLLMQKATINRLFFGKPKSVTLTFKNKGNVAEAPRGIATVSNANNSKIFQKGVINEGSLEVYPTKQLTLETDMQRVAYDWLPGRRTVAVQYRADNSPELTLSNIKIWYIPNGLVFGSLILAGFAVLFYSKRQSLKNFNYKKINKIYHIPNQPKVRKILVTAEDNEAYKIPFHRS